VFTKTDATRHRQARSWAALIQQVWEVDSLKCAKCRGCSPEAEAADHIFLLEKQKKRTGHLLGEF
jgi:hypothetical protein